jgi:hypothetical protein
MKKYLLTILTLIFAFGFCANAYADTDDEEYEDKYAAVINDYYDYVANYSSKSSKAEKYKCLSEIAGFSGKLQLKDVGYSIEDITGDEVPELIFCKVDKYSGKNSTGKDVRAVYSIVDEEPKLIFQSKNYNNFSHIGNGKFTYSGSSGKYQTLGICRLTKSGSKLKWDNFYFLKTKKVYGYYRSILFSNKTGKTDEKASKERVIKDQEFARLWKNTFNQVKPMKITPFSLYTRMSVYYKEDVKGRYKDYKRYELEAGEPEAKVFFVPSKSVKNFRLIGLTYKDSDDEGDIEYDKKILYKTKTLSPKKPLLADVSMFATVPTLGISYVDDTGKTHKYIVYQSGKDGSVLLAKEDF